MKNWSLLAAARDLGIPQVELERIGPTLDGLEAAFRPLAEQLKPAMEPAIQFTTPKALKAEQEKRP